MHLQAGGAEFVEQCNGIIYTVFTRLQAPSELTPTSSKGLEMKEKSAIKRLSRIEAWSTKFKFHACTIYFQNC